MNGRTAVSQNHLQELMAMPLFTELMENVESTGPVCMQDMETVLALVEQQWQEEERKRKEQQARQQEEEHILRVTSMELPMDWDELLGVDPATEGVHADSVSDGLILSLTNLGRVDIPYIAAITGEDLKTVICVLEGSIYQNPETWGECFYQGWETAEEYLSGNMVRKWKAAKAANQTYRGYFARNLTAIEKVLPKSVSAKDIYITIGSPWVPTDVIDAFISHILDLRGMGYMGTRHDEHTGTWEIPNKSSYNRTVEARVTYGTVRMDALHILENTLNMKSVAVTDEVTAMDGKKKRVVNSADTVAALEKQRKMIAEFQSWVWKSKSRKERLEMIFENNFSCVRRRQFDGSFLRFPTMNPEVMLAPYQKNAVARILFSPNTLLAHDVGSGKTYIMIASGMELRRMGLSKKNLYVVPNNLVGQWQEIFLHMYPQAKLLCVDPKSFTPAKRNGVLERIRDEDFDGIIMAYSCFEQIPLSKDYKIKTIEQELQEVRQLLSTRGKSTGRLRRREEKLREELMEVLSAESRHPIQVYFDGLGITRLYVDEAHNYKNVPVDTKIDRVLGISTTGSKKCRDMLDKVRMIQRNHNGGGVIMATGTPLTNSITDAFVMQKYLQSGELALLELQSFDSWVGMFAERVTEFEIDVDTSGYRLATRFNKFHNLPELTALLSSIADFHQVDSLDGVPELEGYTEESIPRTAEFEDYLQEISGRADLIRSHMISRKEDNMLKLTTDGRKAALDLRLVVETAPFTMQSKVARCAGRVYEIYRETMQCRSTQLIFCDTSTPKKEFNIYDELKRLLTEKGIPQEEIAYIHHADTEAKRQKLFARVRSGEIRVLIGSTFKLGLGVNVQDKLIAVHHLDVPWRPADMTQREGRILRQGNENPKVRIYRYVLEGSFDAYSWQLLENKQRFIVGLLSGSWEERSGSDIDDTVLSYAEVKMLAVGNPLVKYRVEVANKLSRFLALQRKAIETHISLERELAELPARIDNQRVVVKRCGSDLNAYCAFVPTMTKEERARLRADLANAVENNVLATTESVFCSYCGFDIVLPAGMSKEHPYLWLQREGRYYVELGESGAGYLIRVDNVLEGLQKHKQKLMDNLERLLRRQLAVRRELGVEESYTDAIEACRKELARLDEILGVDKK